MALLNWNEKLSVGVESIDDQHKVLVDTLNELHHAVMKGEQRNSTEPLLRSLLAYTREHHTAEEQMMVNVNYPELMQHQSRIESSCDSAGISDEHQSGRSRDQCRFSL